jgi:hypothetical protein
LAFIELSHSVAIQSAALEVEVVARGRRIGAADRLALLVLNQPGQ